MENFEKYVGQVFDNRYKLIRIIGVGGMAVVFEANDLLMKRKVAVKVLKDDISEDTQSVRRFINESKAVAMLSHPNIVNIYDVSVKDNLKYIVMEYIEGITLKSYMTKRGQLPFREIVNYTEQILRALEHAHSKGIIHRDIKPQNILLLKNGAIKVTDFGIAKLPNSETLTVTDKAIGTVYYISPEQASGKPTTQASDLYSLGILMYEMATGKLPFVAESPISVALMQVNNEPEEPRKINQQIPRGLQQIILTAMRKSPENRYQSASQMLKQVLKLKANPDTVFKEKINKKSGKRTSKKKDEQNSSMLPIVLGVVTALLIVCLVSGIIVAKKLLFQDDSDGSLTVTVPNLVGTVYTSTDDLGINLDYYRVRVETIFDNDAVENQIIEQSPLANEKKKVIPGQQYCDITITVSKGSKKLLIKDYSIYESREAELALKKMGLAVRINSVYHDTIPSGHVVETYPEAGSYATVGDTIILYVSLGEKIEYATVPNFIGMTKAEAKDALIESGFALGNVSYVFSDRPADEVIGQTPHASASSPKNSTKIDFVISLGTDESTIDYEEWFNVYIKSHAEDMSWDEFCTWMKSLPASEREKILSAPPKEKETEKPEETTKPDDETTSPEERKKEPKDS